MASCDTTVLTGQEGLIQFKPLGTTNCVDDYCPFVDDRIYLGCAAEYNIDDCLSVDVDNIPTGEGQAPSGGSVLVEGDTLWVVDTGVGAAGDTDACGNDMQGVPYIIVSADKGGTPITWDGSAAGEATASGVIKDATDLDIDSTGGSGYTAGTYEGVKLTGGSGSGAIATVVVGAGTSVDSVIVTSGGSGYADTDSGLGLSHPDLNTAGTEATVSLAAGDTMDVRGNSDRGRYTFRLCDFQTVCGVRSFSIDLSRDELDVTTLPCSVSSTCGAELASFRKTQAGFATATGSLEVYFSCDQTSTANKLLTGSLQKTQGSATVRLYVCTKVNPDGSIDETNSLFIEADIQLLGMSFSVDPDNPTTATINFGVTEVRSAFGLQGN